MNFYPRPPRGGRQKPLDYGILGVTFLSTPSARRATSSGMSSYHCCSISIHALREEGDHPCTRSEPCRSYFYPRPPRGGRRAAAEAVNRDDVFLSTPSARRATDHHSGHPQPDGYFYPRPPRGGRRATKSTLPCSVKYFYPRPPRGGRLQARCDFFQIHRISIHALREEGDSTEKSQSLAMLEFLSTPSARRATTHGLQIPIL